jgi:hypothetical protein
LVLITATATASKKENPVHTSKPEDAPNPMLLKKDDIPQNDEKRSFVPFQR